MLDNWLPRTSDIMLRNGFEAFATGMVGPVETLMTYDNGPVNQMFAAADNAFFDVSVTGVVGAPVASGFGSNRWQHVQAGTAGGQFLLAFNGNDTPQKYDGATWTANTITGVGLTSSNLIAVNIFKQRVFMIEKGAMNFWYFPVLNITGAASKFDLSSLCRLGGELIAMTTWTLDAGDGLDDQAVFITSHGEVLVYQGTDPSSATDWSLVGIYRIGAPIGRRCFMRYGGDVYLITQDGVVALSQSLISGRAQPRQSVSDKISNAVLESTQTYGSNFGWQAVLYPFGGYGLINVPIAENSAAYQYVFNTITRAWCRFTGMDASCWALFSERLYFGGAGAVYQADSGPSDNGSLIVGDCKPAFNYFGRRGSEKRFTGVRPIFNAGATVFPAIQMNVDYEDVVPGSVPISPGGQGSIWDVAMWDVSPWGAAMGIRKDFQSVAAVGYCGALRTKVATKTQSISLLAIDYYYEPGGYL